MSQQTAETHELKEAPIPAGVYTGLRWEGDEKLSFSPANHVLAMIKRQEKPSKFSAFLQKFLPENKMIAQLKKDLEIISGARGNRVSQIEEFILVEDLLSRERSRPNIDQRKDIISYQGMIENIYGEFSTLYREDICVAQWCRSATRGILLNITNPKALLYGHTEDRRPVIEPQQEKFESEISNLACQAPDSPYYSWPEVRLYMDRVLNDFGFFHLAIRAQLKIEGDDSLADLRQDPIFNFRVGVFCKDIDEYIRLYKAKSVPPVSSPSSSVSSSTSASSSSSSGISTWAASSTSLALTSTSSLRSSDSSSPTAELKKSPSKKPGMPEKAKLREKKEVSSLLPEQREASAIENSPALQKIPSDSVNRTGKQTIGRTAGNSLFEALNSLLVRETDLTTLDKSRASIEISSSSDVQTSSYSSTTNPHKK